MHNNVTIGCLLANPFNKYNRIACDERKGAEVLAQQMLDESEGKGVVDPAKNNANVFTAPSSSGSYFPTTHKLTQGEINSLKIYSDQELTDLLAAVNGSISANTVFLGITPAQLTNTLPVLQAEYNRRDLANAGYTVKQKAAAATLAKIEADQKYTASLQQVSTAQRNSKIRRIIIWGSIITVAAGATIYAIKKLKK